MRQADLNYDMENEVVVLAKQCVKPPRYNYCAELSVGKCLHCIDAVSSGWRLFKKFQQHPYTGVYQASCHAMIRDHTWLQNSESYAQVTFKRVHSIFVCGDKETLPTLKHRNTCI